MSDLAGIYASSIHDSLRLYANWPIGDIRKLGDYGKLYGDVFVKEGNLFEEKRFKPKLKRRASKADIVFRFTSQGVSVARLAGGASGVDPASGVQARAGVKISFESGNSVYFRSIKLKHVCIDNAKALNTAILKAFGAGEWDGRTVVVQSLFASDGTTVLISSNDKASIEIEAEANAALPIDLADAKLGLSIASENNVGLSAIAATGLTPLMSLVQVRPINRWLAWLGMSDHTVRPLAAAPDTGFGAVETRTSPLLPTSVDVPPEIAAELRKPVDEVFQVVEID
ncbi:MAG: hypothetical protein RIC55_24330 [Pirellulaceae bacterium]